LFLRTDPFAPVIPIYWAILLDLLLIGIIVVWSIERPVRRQVNPPLLVVSALLAILALVLPFNGFRGLSRPDERFALPALLVAFAALRFKKSSPRPALLAGCIMLLVIGQHLLEYYSTGESFKAVYAAEMAVIPPGETTLSLTVDGGFLHGGCEPDPVGFSSGAPSIEWFDLYRLTQTGNLRSRIMETSVVHAKFDYKQTPNRNVLTISPEEVRKQTTMGPTFAPAFSFVEVFGCPNDILTAESALEPEYLKIREGDGFALFSRR